MRGFLEVVGAPTELLRKLCLRYNSPGLHALIKINSGYEANQWSTSVSDTTNHIKILAFTGKTALCSLKQIQGVLNRKG